MEDSLIIELYFKRAEEAIKETDIKYHHYCANIGYNILKNYQDTEECINDCYFNAWNVIPPTRPNSLQGFLGKIMRNLSDQPEYHVYNTCIGVDEWLFYFIP